MNSRRPLCVIIGSGRTGRGFLAPLVQAGGWDYAFVDKNPELVTQLKSHATRVRYFGGRRGHWTAPPAQAYLAGTSSAESILKAADLVVTAVGANNLRDVAKWLTAWSEGTEAVPALIACENGIDVAASFTEAGYPAPAVQAAVFCTTSVDSEGDALGLVSEDVASIPYDGRYGAPAAPSTFEPHPDFGVLMQRKLYTYNALTAAISYPAALLEEEWLAEAARIPSVEMLVSLARQELDAALGRKYGLTEDDQRSFSGRALGKFRNREIQDPVTRNTREVVRKLAPNERIVAPMLLAYEQEMDPAAVSVVLAAAIEWGRREGEIADVDALDCWQVLPPSERERVDHILASLRNRPISDDSLAAIVREVVVAPRR